VGLASGQSDGQGKMELVRQQLDTDQWPQMEAVEQAIQTMEK